MASEGDGNRKIQGLINTISRRAYRQSKDYEVVLKKDSEISKSKKEKYKSLALKARKVLSEEEASSSDSEDEEYAMAVRDFKKFFRRRGEFFRQPHDDKKNFRKIKEDKKEKEDRSDSEDDSKKEEICLMVLDNNEENKKMILNSLRNGPLVWPIVVEEDGTTRTKTCLPPDVYSIVNHHKVSKEIWDKVKLLMQGTKLSLQEKECKLYNEFDKFSFMKGETLYQYYWRFAQLISSIQPTINLEIPLIQETKPLFKTEGLLCNKYNGGKDKVMAVIAIRVMLLVLEEIMQEGWNATWFKEKAMLAEAQESGQILDEEQLEFLADPGILDGQAAQKTIPNIAAFQTEDLNAYDFDCDDVSNAKAVLMANLSNHGSDIISKVPHHEPYHTDMDNQSVHTMHGFEQTPVLDFTNNEITSDSNIIPYSQYLQETQQAAVQDTNLYPQQDSMIISMIEQMSEQMINHVNNWEKANQEKNIESITAELERYKE
ncbi:hypothetical protein Tco_0047211 [Tanacetum coccineum]